MNDAAIDQMEITTQIYIEALVKSQSMKIDQVLFIWNIEADSYDYVIAAIDEAIPDVVQSPYITRYFTHKEKPHE